ncbi:sulfotransferase family 2 domain-containing protein [Salipiger mangrovisoli]|uniref:Sulfotransferase family 2 domain-containing protein n=1 Tax=Salipiger mangrovisoli TaxID=2865933 RepID=A0ABR9X9U0_9RHOB|nr:sulfotransferase family 2 domain-containing protein [Salipiger mangrovisoli]MBE9640246.1 sulfotransferase family 2 domain-containing protein [Salipiger mangrovisoli]
MGRFVSLRNRAWRLIGRGGSLAPAAPVPVIDERVVLFHFPKTGGTSLHRFLLPQFRPEAVCPERLRNIDRFGPEELAAFRYVSAHMDYQRLQLIPAPRYTITVLREPKARVLSLYYFWRAHAWRVVEARNLKGPRLAKEKGLLEFLRHRTEGIPSDIDNYYARSLIGRHWVGPRGEMALPDEEALPLALERLAEFDTIGFTEDMPGLFSEVTARLGIAMPQPLPWALSARDRASHPDMEEVVPEEITPEIDAELERLTRLDRVIYEEARRRFGRG